MFDRKQSQLDTGWGSYAVILLLSPLVSLTTAKFKGVSERCFVVALFFFPALYVYPNILSAEACFEAALKLVVLHYANVLSVQRQWAM